MGIRDRVAALLGISAFRGAPDTIQPSIDSKEVDAIREAHGGQLALTPQSQTRWYLRDLEAAELAADTGDLSFAARLMRSARRDGIYGGVLSTRTGGLVRLTKRYRGDPEIKDALDVNDDETRGIFDEMFPATELALLAADGFELGVAVAEMVPVVGRDFPVMVRLDPEWLWYRWNDNRWYYRSIAGMLPIVPGDGRWILHMPGGRVSPWQHGAWRAIGRAYIRKEHAAFRKDNWEAKLANSARVAVAPQGASETQKDSWFRSVMAWGVNTVFGMTPGYDVKLVESNGRGYESFQQTISDQNDEFKMSVAGQLVTSDGGAGFQNSDIHKSIRADLIKETADGLAHTINTQGLPQYIIDHFGEEALFPGSAVEWDVTPPKDRNAEAMGMQTAAGAISSLTSSLATHGLKLDARAMAIQFGIPIDEDEDEDGLDALLFDVSLSAGLELASQVGLQPTEEAVRSIVERAGIELEDIPTTQAANVAIPLAPTDIAKVVRVDEARASINLTPWGGGDGQVSIAEFGATAEAAGDVEVEDAKTAGDIEVEGAKTSQNREDSDSLEAGSGSIEESGAA